MSNYLCFNTNLNRLQLGKSSLKQLGDYKPKARYIVIYSDSNSYCYIVELDFGIKYKSLTSPWDVELFLKSIGRDHKINNILDNV